MSTVSGSGGSDESGRAAALIEAALHSCLRGEALERERILALLALPPASDGARLLRQAAHKAALALTGGRAYLWGALGLDYAPCPMNCAFCSLGEDWGLISAPRSYTQAEALRHARAFAEAGARFIVLRTTQFYDLDRLCALLRAIRTAVPGAYELILNTGGCDAAAAKAIRRAGGAGVYHTVRLREGRDTPFDSAGRLASMRAAVEGGLRLTALVEPVGPEHSDEELADAFLRIVPTGATISGVMARVPVPGTPLGAQPPLSKARLAQLTAVFRLAGGRQISDICAHPAGAENAGSGANIMVVEKGAVPRDHAHAATDWQAFTTARAARCLRRAGYTPCDGAGKPLTACEEEEETAMTTSDEKPVRVLRPEHSGARITVLLQPEESRLSLPRPKTARQLLEALNLAEETALVARGGELLTPDRRLWPNDELLVRKVASSG